ncbi:MAG TPA: long-chain fatty acid--CoA ligase [Marinobacter sp.]|uniref:Long-chain fatty acid--CoA ligase n=2 Tax=root TaxID=1 RepID=A0A831R507_9GAMM|nr:AMP-binding protein [Marinobacter antarcticus]HDZ38286.1 long-chain fatty acid--CoA ligase [Marinobacter sp.]HEA52928.1 long-chain fatty acid--CoA ligase [Marinobacter antarcticus]
MTTPRIRDLTLVQMLRAHAAERPDALALRQKDFGIWQAYSWQDYYQRSRHFGLGLRALGLSEGGHVAILSENRVEWVIAQMGIGLVNGICVGVYPTSPWNEVAYVLAHSDAEMVVCEDQEQTDKVLEAWPQLPQLKHNIVVDYKGLRAYPSPPSSFEDIEKMGQEFEKTHPELIDQLLDRQKMDDIALMIYTSGSTGRPKGAMISWGNVQAGAPGLIELLEVDQHSTSLSYLPLCHVAEQALTNIAPVYVGSAVSFGESLRTVQEDLREIAPTFFLGVPRIWEKLHSAIYIKMQETGRLRQWLFNRAMSACEPMATKPKATWSLGEQLTYRLFYWLVFRALQNFIGLRRCTIALTGAAPISTGIVQFFRTLGVPLVEVYGQTESTGVATAQRLDTVCLGTIGTAVAGLEVKLGEQNEILMRGGTVFKGYYKNDEATAATLKDGWLYTGDVGEWREGQLRIVDRLKDIMITAGGKNLSPTEIENTLKASPYIKECIVIGEARKFVSALIQIDFETAAKWAEQERIAYTTFRSLTEQEKVRELIQTEVDKGNDRLPQVAQIKCFHLLSKELDHDDDEVTATMKVRRSKIYEKYNEVIESLYN